MPFQKNEDAFKSETECRFRCMEGKSYRSFCCLDIRRILELFINTFLGNIYELKWYSKWFKISILKILVLVKTELDLKFFNGFQSYTLKLKLIVNQNEI